MCCMVLSFKYIFVSLFTIKSNNKTTTSWVISKTHSRKCEKEF